MLTALICAALATVLAPMVRRGLDRIRRRRRWDRE